MHNIVKLLVIIGLLSTAAMLNAQSKEYVVNQQASNAMDNNPGTAQRPFLSIDKGLSVLKPGDTLLIVGSKEKDSKHAVYSRSGKHGINLNQHGTTSQPISIRANGFVILRGNGSMHGINLDNAAHYVVNGFIFEHFKKACEGFTPSTNILIEDCEFTKTKETGMRMREWQDCTLRKVTVHHCAETGLFLKNCRNILLDNVHSIANSDGQGSAGDGDGYTTHHCTNITFIHCSAQKNSEDGFDLTGNHVLINCKSINNNTCNVKLWRRDGDKFKENMTYMLGCLVLGAGEANIKLSNGAGLYLSHSIIDQAGEEGVAFRNNKQTPVESQIIQSVIMNSKRFGIDRQSNNPLKMLDNIFYNNTKHIRGIDNQNITVIDPLVDYDKSFNVFIPIKSPLMKMKPKKEAIITQLLENNDLTISKESRVAWPLLDKK